MEIFEWTISSFYDFWNGKLFLSHEWKRKRSFHHSCGIFCYFQCLNLPWKSFQGQSKVSLSFNLFSKGVIYFTILKLLTSILSYLLLIKSLFSAWWNFHRVKLATLLDSPWRLIESLNLNVFTSMAIALKCFMSKTDFRVLWINFLCRL